MYWKLSFGNFKPKRKRDFDFLLKDATNEQEIVDIVRDMVKLGFSPGGNFFKHNQSYTNKIVREILDDLIDKRELTTAFPFSFLIKFMDTETAAQHYLAKMKDLEFLPDLDTYNHLIKITDDEAMAREYMTEIKERRIKPNKETFVGLMKFVEDRTAAFNIVDEMWKEKVLLNVKDYRRIEEIIPNPHLIYVIKEAFKAKEKKHILSGMPHAKGTLLDLAKDKIAADALKEKLGFKEEIDIIPTRENDVIPKEIPVKKNKEIKKEFPDPDKITNPNEARMIRKQINTVDDIIEILNNITLRAPAIKLMEEAERSGIPLNYALYRIFLEFLNTEFTIRNTMKKMKLRGIIPEVDFYNSLLIYAKDEAGARDVFAEMERHKIVQNSVSYDLLLFHISEVARMKELLDEMKIRQVPYTAYSYRRMFWFCTTDAELWKLWEEMKKDGVKPDIHICELVIERLKDEWLIKKVFDAMTEYRMPVSAKYYSDFFNNAKDEGVKRQLLLDIKSHGRKISGDQYEFLIKTTTDIVEATLYLRTMREKEIYFSHALYSHVLDQATNLPDAMMVIDEMIANGTTPNSYSFNRLFKHATGDANALELMETFINKGAKPTIDHFHTLIKHVKNADNIYFNLIKNMKAYGIMPTVTTYNFILDNKSFVESIGWKLMMEEDGIEPNEITYSFIIKHCRDMETAKKYIKMMLEKGFNQNIYTYGTLIRLSIDFETGFGFLDEMVQARIMPNELHKQKLLLLAKEDAEKIERVEARFRVYE